MRLTFPSLDLMLLLSAIIQMASRWRARLTAGFSPPGPPLFWGCKGGRCGRGLPLLFSKTGAKRKCPEGSQQVKSRVQNPGTHAASGQPVWGPVLPPAPSSEAGAGTRIQACELNQRVSLGFRAAERRSS